jgi:hypothetical protein
MALELRLYIGNVSRVHQGDEEEAVFVVYASIELGEPVEGGSLEKLITDSSGLGVVIYDEHSSKRITHDYYRNLLRTITSKAVSQALFDGMKQDSRMALLYYPALALLRSVADVDENVVCLLYGH